MGRDTFKPDAAKLSACAATHSGSFEDQICSQLVRNLITPTSVALLNHAPRQHQHVLKQLWASINPAYATATWPAECYLVARCEIDSPSVQYMQRLTAIVQHLVDTEGASS